MDKLIAVIPAAGAGKRMGMGMNKAFVPVREVPILVHCENAGRNEFDCPGNSCSCCR